MTTKQVSPFKAGDTVIVHTTGLGGGHQGRVEEAVVDRVGRNTAHVRWGSGTKAFDAFDGNEKGDYCHSRIYTVDAWDDHRRREDLTDRLLNHGVTLNWQVREELSTDKLTRLVAVLDD